MSAVVDASVVVAALVDAGRAGRWAETVLDSESLVAPHLLPAEVASALRRMERSRVLERSEAAAAHAAVERMRFEYAPYEPFADRIRELRANLSSYDAWYVAVAEAFDLPLATLDARLRRSAGVNCRVLVVPR